MNISGNISSTNKINAVASNYITSYGYVAVGVGSLVTNLFIFFVLFRSKKFLLQSAFVFGLTVGDSINGLGMAGLGALRIYNIANDNALKVHPIYCMLGYPALMIVGSQITATMFFLIGLERLLAVRFFNWYYQKWSNKLSWLFVTGAFAFCSISVFFAFIITYLKPADALVAKDCGPSAAVGNAYMVYQYFQSVICGIYSVVSTLVAWRSFALRKRKIIQANSSTNERMNGHLKKQWDVTLTMVSIAVIDFFVSVIPNLLLILSSGQIISLSNFSGWAIQTIGLRSMLNVFLYFVISKEFRTATFKATNATSHFSVSLSLT